MTESYMRESPFSGREEDSISLPWSADWFHLFKQMHKKKSIVLCPMTGLPHLTKSN